MEDEQIITLKPKALTKKKKVVTRMNNIAEFRDTTLTTKDLPVSPAPDKSSLITDKPLLKGSGGKDEEELAKGAPPPSKIDKNSCSDPKGDAKCNKAKAKAKKPRSKAQEKQFKQALKKGHKDREEAKTKAKMYDEMKQLLTSQDVLVDKMMKQMGTLLDSKLRKDKDMKKMIPDNNKVADEILLEGNENLKNVIMEKAPEFGRYIERRNHEDKFKFGLSSFGKAY